jgi:hypothetical protein
MRKASFLITHEIVERLQEQPGIESILDQLGLDALVAPVNYAVTRWAALDGWV